MSRPFRHPSLSNLKSGTRWPDITEKVVEATKTTDFITKMGANSVFFYYDFGIIGWLGRREADEQPKVLSKKASLLLDSTNAWKGHLKQYGTKVKNKERKMKYIFIDLGIAVYESEGTASRKRGEVQQQIESNTPGLGECTESSVTVATSKPPAKKRKQKGNERFVAPSVLVIDILGPVEFYNKDSCCKTARVDAIDSFELSFDRYVVGRFPDLLLDSDSSSLEDNSVTDEIVNTSSISNDSDDVVIVEDDLVIPHIYSSIYNRIAYYVIKKAENDTGALKCYKGRIGKKVHTCIISISIYHLKLV